MMIGGTDGIAMIKNAKRIRRNKKTSSASRPGRLINEPVELNNSSSSAATTSTSSSYTAIAAPKIARQSGTTKNPKAPMLNLAHTLDRYGVSNRAGAAITSSLLQDIGILSPDKNNDVIDPNKIRRIRTNARELLKPDNSSLVLKSLYFDGRKDKTMSVVNHRRVFNTEEHVSLIQEPGSVFIGHVSPSSGTASSMLTSILQFLEVESIGTDHLRAIGCDGTNVNTGIFYSVPIK
jgi:hypothetical protein